MWAFPPRRIVVAVDFGDASASAVVLAGAIARAFTARLQAVHAETMEAPAYFLAEQVRSIEQQRRAARAHATTYLKQFVARVTDVHVDAHISDGPATEAILVAAQESDLLVMGTHGRRGPSRWWAGSVAERVARAAHVPVLIVRAGASADPFARVAVLVGNGVADQGARRYAEGLTTAFGGDPPRELADAAAAAEIEAASLVVVPQPPAGTMLSLSGSVEHLLRTSRHPVLFVPSV
jgi:nucleotide-binding universal stress UspA family protein